jgi:multidrug transporter EmrE-like cation transporter
VLPAPLIHLLSPRVAKVVIPLLAALMVWWGTLSQQPVAWNAVIGLMFLAGVTQYLCVSLFSVDRLSVAAAILFTSALLTGLPGVALVSAAIVLASILAQTKLPWRHRFSSAVLYQWGTDVIACSAPALLITILALPLHVSYALLFGAPFVLVALFYSYTTAALTALDQTLMTGKSFVHLWREEYQELPWHYLLLALIGLCFAIVYTMFGWKGMVLSALPIYIMYFSQEHLAGQTKQWWGHYVVSKKQWS